MRTVAVAVIDDMPMYELGIACEVFREPFYDLRLCGPKKVRIESGFTIRPENSLRSLAAADTVVIPALPHACMADRPIPTALVKAVEAAAGARMVSLCSGAFVLAAAGILDGMRATTHWQQCARLADTHPNVDVDPSVLYVDNGNVLTSAGRSAALDLCLHIVRTDFGAQVANSLARTMVVATHRSGGQAEYVPQPLPPTDGLGDVLAWAAARLDQPVTVTSWARQAKMSERTFVRRFGKATGTTPRQWLLSQRLNRARELLESTSLSVDQVSERSGLGSAANLRQHFTAVVGATPSEYRRAFRTTS